jgi:chaperonin GroEL
MTKDMLFEDEARQAIFEGVKILARAVKTTLGPTGRNVVIKKGNGAPHITKDGVTVAREVSLADKFQNLGVELVREVVNKTATAAGDGTTTATVLAEAILENGAKFLASGVNTTELKRGIDLAVKAVVAHLDKTCKKISSEQETIQVATISANNDTEIGNLLGNLISEIGANGVATVEKTAGTELQIQKVEGLQVRGGYFSPYFANKDNGEAVYDDPRILIYDGRITAARDLILGNPNGFLERALIDGRPLVIIAEGIDGEAFHALVLNKVNGGQKILAVRIPFDANKIAILDDIATLTGGKVLSREAGCKQLHKVDLDELGTAGRIVATKDMTLILRGGGDAEQITAKVNSLQASAAAATSDYEKKVYKERAAKLSKGIAIIRVGAASEVELNEKYDRIEDALYATQAAVEEGIVPGGGVALARCISVVDALLPALENDNQRMGAKILRMALSSPLKQIAENAGLSGDVVLDKVLSSTSSTYGYNARSGVYCDMFVAGIIDPVKVAKVALLNAASVAGLVLTTDVLLVESDKPSQNSSKLN